MRGHDGGCRSAGGSEATAREASTFSLSKRPHVLPAYSTSLRQQGAVAVDELARRLLDGPRYEREAAAEALGLLGDTQAVEALVIALGDSRKDVRALAAEALGRLGDARAIGPLAESLATDLAETAAEVLKHLGTLYECDTRAVNALTEHLSDHRWPVRRAAAEALGEIGAAQSHAALIGHLLGDHPDVRRAAAEALASLGDLRWSSIIRGDDLDAARLGEASDWGIVGALVDGLTDRPESFQVAIADLLGAIRDDRACEPLIDLLHSDSHAVRQSAAKALGIRRDNRGVGSLVDRLTDADPGVVAAAASALGAIGDKGAVAPLLARLEHDNPFVLAAVVESLGRLTAVSALSQLVVLLGRADLHVAAAKAIAALGDPASVGALEGLLDDRQQQVRTIAAQALAKLGQPCWLQWLEDPGHDPRPLGGPSRRAIGWLLAWLRDGSQDQRMAAACCLADVHDDQTVELLISWLADKSLCDGAAMALGRIGDRRAVAPLLRMLKSQRSAVTIEALGLLADARAISPLLALAGTPDPQVRSAVATALGELDDSRIVDQLIVLLEDKVHCVRRASAHALKRQHDSGGLTRDVQLRILAVAPTMAEKHADVAWCGNFHNDSGIGVQL